MLSRARVQVNFLKKLPNEGTFGVLSIAQNIQQKLQSADGWGSVYSFQHSLLNLGTSPHVGMDSPTGSWQGMD